MLFLNVVRLVNYHLNEKDGIFLEAGTFQDVSMIYSYLFIQKWKTILSYDWSVFIWNV